MANQPSPTETQPSAARRGLHREPGSVQRFLASIVAAGAIAIVWAIIWAMVYAAFRHLDIAWLDIFVGAGIGLSIRKLWGIGGAVAALNSLLIMTFSVGLAHLILFEHYALMQQSADDIGIAPSFRTVIAHLTTAHWVFCASGLAASLVMPLRRGPHDDVNQTHAPLNRKPGSAKGIIKLSDDLDTPLDDFKDYV